MSLVRKFSGCLGVLCLTSSILSFPLKSSAISPSTFQKDGEEVALDRNSLEVTEPLLIGNATQNDQIKMLTILEVTPIRPSTGVSSEAATITTLVAGGLAALSGPIGGGAALLIEAGGRAASARSGMALLVDAGIAIGSSTGDNLYITVNDNRVWPLLEYRTLTEYPPLPPGRPTVVGATAFLDRNLTIKLMDQDLSGDDLLNNPPLTISRNVSPADEVWNTRRNILVENRQEGSLYMMTIQVSAATSIGPKLISNGENNSIAMTPLLSYGDPDLENGSYLKSENGRFTLIMQDDSNLVIYEDGNRPVWASGSQIIADAEGRPIFGQGPFEARMQSDGNFVVYNESNRPIWETNTDGRGQGPYELVLQDDRNLVIYDSQRTVIWASNTDLR
ncbi:MAG: hypothetical protein ACHWZW_09300 [Spirulina sp.]